MDNDFIPQVLDLVSKHAWVPLAALVINLLVRQLKSDAALPINVPPRWRSLAALVLGIVSGVLQAVVSGTKWADAIIGGLISAALAVFGHETTSTAIANGGNVMPRFGKAKRSPSAPLAAGIVFLVLFVPGCSFFSSPTGKVVECGAASMAEVLAQLCPPPVTPICTEIAAAAFEQACEEAASKGASQDDATAAGLRAARGQMAKLRARDARMLERVTP